MSPNERGMGKRRAAGSYADMAKRRKPDDRDMRKRRRDAPHERTAAIAGHGLHRTDQANRGLAAPVACTGLD